MKKKLLGFVLVICFIVPCCFMLSSCGEKEYTISFEENGGTVVSNITVKEGKAISPPPKPTKNGYSFDGWFFSEDFSGTIYDFGKMPNENKTLYAKWNLVNYGIYYELNGGTVEDENPEIYNIETDDFTLNNPTKIGSVFLGWTGSNGTTAQTTVSIIKGTIGEKTYTANWELEADTDPVPTSYSVTLDANGGQPLGKLTYCSGDTITLPDPTYGEKVFLGWYSDKNVWKKKVISGVINLAEDFTLYARWGVYVSFDCAGGTELQSSLVDLGSTLDELPATYKEGFIHSGWYYDESLTNKAWEGDTVVDKMVLHAKFSASSTGVISKMKLVEDVTDTSVIIESTLILTSANVSDYIDVKSTGGESVTIDVGDGGGLNRYKLTSAEYIAGKTYVIKQLTDELKFVSIGNTSVDFDTTQLSFNVYKENYNSVTMKPVKHIQLVDIAMFKEKVYLFESNDADNGKSVNSLLTFKKDGISYTVEDIISLSENETTGDDDLFYKIIGVNEETWGYAPTENEAVVETDFYYLEVIEADLEDIYNDFDAFSSGKVKLKGLVTLSPEAIAESVAKNEALASINMAFSRSVPKMPTIMALEERLNESDRETLSKSMTAFEFSIKDIYVICPTEDSVKLKLAFEYAIKISNICTITFGMSFEDTISINFSYNLDTYEDGIIDKYLIELYTDLANEFKLSLSAEIEFTHDAINLYGSAVTGGSDGTQDKFDLFDEIETVMDSDNLSALQDALKGNPLEGEEDAYNMEYQELFNVPMATIPIPVTNIITFEISFNAVVAIGAKAGVYIDISQSFVEQTRIANGEINNGVITLYDDGFQLTQTQLKSDFTLNVTLKGKLGIRCGIEAKFSVGIAHTNSLASVYISLTFGPYIELSGIFRYEYKYDAVRNISSSELSGGMFFEAGLFLDLKIGVNFLSIESDTSLWTKQFPFFRVGDIRCPIRFSNYRPNSDKTFATALIDSRSAYISYVGETLNVDYINLDTGEIVENAKPSWLNFEYSVPEKYKQLVKVDSAKRRIYISPEFTGTSLYFEIVAEYKGTGTSFADDMRIVLCYSYSDSQIESGSYYQYGVYTFRNQYKDQQDSCNQLIEQKLVYMGFPITSPITDESQFPVRHGYYLDIDDLWIKKDVYGNVDESFDGNFGVATIEENYAYYYLNWKKRNFSAEIFAPTYNAEGKETGLHSLGVTKMYLSAHPYRNSANTFFFVPKSAFNVSEYFGRVYKGIGAPNFNNRGTYVFGEGNLDVPAGEYYKIYFVYPNTLEEELTQLASKTVSLYLEYETQEYRVTFDSSGISFGISYTCRPADKGYNAPPAVEVPWAIGDPITTIYKDTYEVTGYRDIDIDAIYTDVSTMPVVTRDFRYEVLYSKSRFTVNYVTDNGIYLYSQQLNGGDTIPTPVLDEDFYAKINQRDWLYFVGYTYEFILPENSPTVMPQHDINYVLTVKYLPEERTVTFNGFDAERDYEFTTESKTDEDGKAYVAFTGKTTMKDYGQTFEETHFTVPELKSYVDKETGKRYKFMYWTTDVGYRRILGHGTVNEYYIDCTYTPVFEAEDIEFIAIFKTTSALGNELHYTSFTGNLFGKTLAEVISEYNVGIPVRTDYDGIYEYTFNGWGVNADTFEFGTEFTQNGELKTKYIFNAAFTGSKLRYNAVLHANGGIFSDNTDVKTISGTADETMQLDDISLTKESDDLGDYVFVGWSYTENYNPLRPVTMLPNKCFPVGGVDLYAVFSLALYERTVTITGSVKEGEETITAYFGDIESQTSMNISCYDGEVISIRTSSCYFRSASSYYSVIYFSWMEDGEEHRAYKDDYGSINVTVSGDMTITAVYVYDCARNYVVHFETTGYLFEDGELDEDYEPLGYYGLYQSNTTVVKKYRDTMEAPFVTGKDPTDVFVGWARSGDDGIDFDNLIPAGTTIVFDEYQFYYAVYVYDNNMEICITFNAWPYISNDVENMIESCEYFSDGNVKINYYGATDSPVNFALEPHKEGYAFTGWTTNGVDIYQVSELTFSSDISYYATYALETGHTLTLNAGEGGDFDGLPTYTETGIPSGTLANTLAVPHSADAKKVFSHYEDEKGNVLYYVTGNGAYYAKYAYPVSDFASLCAINNNLTADYVLTQNLFFPEENMDSIIDWTALGATVANGFSGTLNGNGYSIGLYADYKGAYAGLFAKVSGRIFSLNYILTGIVNSTDTEVFGGLTAELAEGGLIENCAVNRFLSINVVNNKVVSIGGLVGINNGTVIGISMFGRQYGASLDCASANVGGVIGINNGVLSEVLDVFTTVKVNLFSGSIVKIGTLVGCNNGKVYNCIGESCPEVYFMNGDAYFALNSVFVGAGIGYNNGVFEHCRIGYYYPYFWFYDMTLEGEIAKGIYELDGEDETFFIYPALFSIRYNEDFVFKYNDFGYHFSEYKEQYPEEAAKLDALRQAVCFSNSCHGIDAIDFMMAENLKNETTSVFEANFDMSRYGYIYTLKVLSGGNSDIR